MRQYSFSTSTEEKLIANLQKLKKEKYVDEASSILVMLSIGSCDSVVADSCISAVSSILPNAKIAGLSSAGEITNGELNSYTISVSIFAFKKSTVDIISCDLENRDPYDTASQISSTANSMSSLRHIHMLITSVSLGQDLSRFLRDFSLNSPSVKVTGVSAADFNAPSAANQDSVFVFSDKIIYKGAICILFSGEDLDVRASMNLGWIPIGKDHVITEVKNEIIVKKIDDQPAADFYRKYLGISISQNLVKNSLEFPIIIKLNANNYIARNIIAAFPDGSLMYTYNVNEGDHFHLSFGSPETILRDAEEDASEISDFQPEAMILSVCTARNMYLGGDEKTEIECYRNICPSVSGCLGFGELYRMGYRVEQLTYALVCLAMRENIPENPDEGSGDSGAFNTTVHSVQNTMNNSASSTSDIEESEKDFGSIADAYAFDASETIDVDNRLKTSVRSSLSKDSDKSDEYSSGLVLVPSSTSDIRKNNSHRPYSIKLTRDTIPLTDRMFSLLRETTSEYVSVKEQGKELNLINELAIEKKANEAKTSFLSHMSHELRTPVNAILGMNEMIIRECSNANILQYSSDIKEAGEALVNVIDDVLDYSRIEAGKVDIARSPYSLFSLLNDLIMMARSQAGKKGLDFRISIDKNIPDELIGDESHIKVCLVNLISNAVKYTSAGHIRFTVSLGENRKKGHANIIFHIKDTGSGIKKDDLQLLFKPFVRIEESKNRNINGTGLGLNITRKLLEMMGSTLMVESVYKKGSDFYFELDQKIDDPTPIGNFDEHVRNISAAASGKGTPLYAPEATVLVVDDNNMNLTVVKKLLERTKVNVDTARSGREACDMAFSKKYDIILMDHLMPEMDGIEALKIIKNQPNGKNIDTPTVILTANAISGMKKKFLDAGFDDYLEKPARPELLEKIIRKYIRSDRLFNLENYHADKHEPDSKCNCKGGSSCSKSKLAATIQDVCEEINVMSGIEACGSEDTFEEILRQYLQNGPDTLIIIKQDLENADYNDFRIKVHSLKSTSALIGALDLSKNAAVLEESVTNGDTRSIISDTPKLLDELDKLLRKLKITFDSIDSGSRKKDCRKAISKERFESAISTISEFISVFDFDSADFIMKDLSKYKIPEDEEEFFTNLKIMIKNVDHDNLMTILERRMHK